MVRHLHRGRRIGSGARLNGKRAMFRGRHPAGRDERLQEQSARDRENSQRTLHPRPINRIAAWFHPLWDLRLRAPAIYSRPSNYPGALG